MDVWEYGCTIYECALGRPPNADLRERQQLKMRMRRLKGGISLPEQDPEIFSTDLRSLVSYTLNTDAGTRPSMKDVLEHEYLKDTEVTHPTKMLTELVETYYAWLFRGGQRVSLFMPGGAAAASTQESDTDTDPDDEWNFSMTQDFERRVSSILEIPDFSSLSSPEMMEGEETPRGPGRPGELSPPRGLTAAQKANFEARVQRGADLSSVFDKSQPEYEYKTKTDFVPIPEQQRRISDLPFRAMAEDRPSSIASIAIDLGDFDEADYAVAAAPLRAEDKIQTAFAGAPMMREETIRLADASTLREKRANSKGPRDPNNQSLTARRGSSSEELPSSTAERDFATSEGDRTIKNRTKPPELQESAEITSSRPGHATMDWSFASAMSEATVIIPEINVPDEDEPGEDSADPTDDDEQKASDLEQSARKHATMEWSFSSAMAEAKATEDEEPTSEPSSPPTASMTHFQKPSLASRPTPTRPAPLMRQMTMPVTMQDFNHAEEQEIPRPSTALSEAYSDVSASSTDIDPFGLEDDVNDDHPGPATMDEDVNMGGFYATRGRTMFSGRGSSDLSTPLTANGPGPKPYAMGRPARIGEDGFPGTGHAHPAAASVQRASTSSQISAATAIPAGGLRSPLVAFVPAASPPSLAALAGDAASEDVEEELRRLLEGMQGTLEAAREVVGGLERRRGGEEEWVSEEE